MGTTNQGTAEVGKAQGAPSQGLLAVLNIMRQSSMDALKLKLYERARGIQDASDILHAYIEALFAVKLHECSDCGKAKIEGKTVNVDPDSSEWFCRECLSLAGARWTDSESDRYYQAERR